MHRLVVLHGQTESSGGFSCQTNDGVAVGTIVGDFELYDGIIVADNLVDIVANLAVLIIEDPDAVENCVGEIVQSQAQFFQTAEHAVGNFATELALGDVYTAGQVGIV